MTSTLPISHAARHCRMRNRKQCELCASVCPVEKNDNSLKELQCLSCGLCAIACPIRAIPAGVDNNAALLWGQELIGKKLHLLCPKAYPQEKNEPILRLSSCALALFPETFFALFALGIKAVILELGQCETCPYALEKEYTCLESIKTLFPNWLILKNNCTEIKENNLQVTAIEVAPFNRRKFFSLFGRTKQQIIPTISKSASCLNQGEGSEGLIPRHLAVHALSILAKEKLISAELIIPHNLLPTYAITINDTCNACGLCSRICPAQALTIQKTSDSFSLYYNAGKCLGCAMCIKLCKTKSVNIIETESSIANLLAETTLVFTA